MKYSLTLLQDHYDQLREILFPADGNEHAAILILGRSEFLDQFDGSKEHRFLLREVIKIEPQWITDASPTQVTVNTTPFFNALKKIENKNFSIGFVHSHRSNEIYFSSYDDKSDAELFEIAFNRNPKSGPHVSLVIGSNGGLIARAIDKDLGLLPVHKITVVGNSIKVFTEKVNSENQWLDRQRRAFGASFNKILGGLRIGIVGCGGTGSAIASLLARAGVGSLVFFDADFVDLTNLNRMHFAKVSDASLGKFKAEVLASAIADLGLGTQIRYYKEFVDKLACRDALKSCDLIFGCTDDHLGRNFLNRYSFFYLTPLIDTGLLIEPNDEKKDYDVFDGRVTVVHPGNTCQVCRKLIVTERMYSENLRRNNPQQYEVERRAGYIPGADAPNPVVVTFTTEVATMAVNELFQRISNFRGSSGGAAERIRKFDMVKGTDLVSIGKSRDNCPLCSKRKYDARGDMEPFLDQS